MIAIISILLIVCYSKYTSDTLKKYFLYILRFSYGISSGLLGGNQFVIKSLTELIKSYHFLKYILKKEILNLFIPEMNLSIIKLILFFLIMTGIVCCGGIMIMNEGLKKYDSISILSLYQGSFILSSSLSGILFFHEFDNTVIVYFIIYF